MYGTYVDVKLGLTVAHWHDSRHSSRTDSEDSALGAFSKLGKNSGNVRSELKYSCWKYSPICETTLREGTTPLALLSRPRVIDIADARSTRITITLTSSASRSLDTFGRRRTSRNPVYSDSNRTPRRT
jgi:hypothetical protein